MFSRIWQCNSVRIKFSETLRNNSIFNILILSPRKLFNAVRDKQTSLNFLTSATDFLPKNNKVHVKLGIAHQACFFTLAVVIRGRHLFQIWENEQC